jgi:hypothetical protein
MRKSASMAECCQEIFLISQEIFKEKQDIKYEAREISKISIKVTNIRSQLEHKYNNHNIKICIMWQYYRYIFLIIEVVYDLLRWYIRCCY